MIWARQHRWHLFCRQQHSAAAFARLSDMVAAYKDLEAQSDSAVPNTDIPLDAAAQADQLTIKQQKLTSCREDIQGLVQAMYDQYGSELDPEQDPESSYHVPGYNSFAEAALAFGLPEVVVGLLKIRLRVCDLCKVAFAVPLCMCAWSMHRPPLLHCTAHHEVLWCGDVNGVKMHVTRITPALRNVLAISLYICFQTVTTDHCIAWLANL